MVGLGYLLNAPTLLSGVWEGGRSIIIVSLNEGLLTLAHITLTYHHPALLFSLSSVNLIKT